MAELIDEHFDFDCNLVQVDAQTWAIHGSIAVDGEVILAEFTAGEAAEVALERLAAEAAANLTAAGVRVMTMYLPNTGVRPTGFEAGEFIEVTSMSDEVEFGTPEPPPASDATDVTDAPEMRDQKEHHEDRRHRRHRLIGSKVVTKLRDTVTRRSRHRRTRASTPSPAKDWPRRSTARQWSSTCRTRRRSRTPRSWSSSRRPPATSSRRERRPASDITSPCRWSARSACPTAATSGRRSRRRS